MDAKRDLKEINIGVSKIKLHNVFLIPKNAFQAIIVLALTKLTVINVLIPILRIEGMTLVFSSASQKRNCPIEEIYKVLKNLIAQKDGKGHHY